MNEPQSKSPRRRFSVVMLASALTACGGGNLDPNDHKPPVTDAQGECINKPTYTENMSACAPLSTDYQPRMAGSVAAVVGTVAVARAAHRCLSVIVGILVL